MHGRRRQVAVQQHAHAALDGALHRDLLTAQQRRVRERPSRAPRRRGNRRAGRASRVKMTLTMSSTARPLRSRMAREQLGGAASDGFAGVGGDGGRAADGAQARRVVVITPRSSRVREYTRLSLAAGVGPASSVRPLAASPPRRGSALSSCGVAARVAGPPRRAPHRSMRRGLGGRPVRRRRLGGEQDGSPSTSPAADTTSSPARRSASTSSPVSSRQPPGSRPLSVMGP